MWQSAPDPSIVFHTELCPSDHFKKCAQTMRVNFFPRSWQYFNVVLVCVGFLNWCWELIYWMAWQSMAVNWCKYIALFRLSFTSLPTLILQHLAAFEFHHDRSSRSTPKPVWLHHQQCRVGPLDFTGCQMCAGLCGNNFIIYLYSAWHSLWEHTRSTNTQHQYMRSYITYALIYHSFCLR